MRLKTSKLVRLILGLSLILLLACSQANDPHQSQSRFTLVTTYQTIGNPEYLDVTDEYVAVAENTVGVGIYHRRTGEPYRQFSEYQQYYADVTINQLRNTGLVKYIPEENYVLIGDITQPQGGNRLFIYNFEEIDGIAQVKTAGFGYLLNDFKYDIVPSETGKIVTYWGSFAGVGTGYLMQKKLLDLQVEPGWDALTDLVSSGMPSESYLIDTTDDYIITSMGEWGVYVANKTGDLSLVDRIDTPGEALAVVYADGYIYVADRHCGLQVVDFRTPGSGVLLENAHRPTSGFASSVAVNGNMLALASGSGGVYIYDISDRANPVQIERMPMSSVGYANMVVFYDGDLYVASRERGVLRLREL